MLDRFPALQRFLSNWQDFAIWLPGAILLLLLLTVALPYFDPRAGVDGLGFLQGYAALLVKGILVTCMAWLSRRLYTLDRTAADETILIADLRERNWIPFALDRLEWAMWLGLWYFVLSG